MRDDTAQKHLDRGILAVRFARIRSLLDECHRWVYEEHVQMIVDFLHVVTITQSPSFWGGG